MLRHLAIGRDDDVIPTKTALRPARVGLDEAAERVAGVAGLADGLDLLDVTTAALLPPFVAVVPHFAAP